MRKQLGIACMAMCFIATSALAMQDHKPRRGKHYLPPDKLGTTTTEELEKPEVVEKKSFLDRIKNDHRLGPWSSWWRTCDRSFSIDALVDAGEVSIDEEWQSYDRSETAGPNKEFLVSKGGRAINPVWGRMKYVKKEGVWQAEMNNSKCAVMLYQGNRARRIISCGELDGIFQGFWVDRDRCVITAYRKISPEMNAECKAKEVGECVAAILWLVDLTDDTLWEYRGPVVTFSQCEPNDLLKKLYPEFFIQEGE